MNAILCPYCRSEIAAGESAAYCNACGTPHHQDCYQENGGCTVFGCRLAPPEEAKIQVSAPELQVSEFAVPVPNTGQTKTRSTYVLLGVLLGAFGAHNFYAGNRNRALIQLGITVLTLGYGSPFSWIWAAIEVCTNDKDSRGMQLAS